ncbi:hypothetical protein QQ045_025000 [Rhodiola kirilowii]
MRLRVHWRNNMEEKGSSEEPAQMPSGTALSGLESEIVSYSTNVPSQQWVENNNAMALRQWMYHPYLPQNYANFMAGSSSGGYQASPLKRDEQKKIAMAPTPLCKVKPSSQVFNNSSWYGASQGNSMTYGQNVWYGMPQLEEELQQKLGSESSQCRIQDDISTTDRSGSNNGGIHPANVAALNLACTQHNKGKKPGTTYENDRRRRKIINEKLKALQELVPQSAQGHPGDLLEDIIDYIKYLQLQLKDLSQSRLLGESVSDPLIFIEGFGHYLVHESMVNEPLDEMMGRLLEVNPQEAAAILESKGLYIRDMSLAKGLQDAL